MTEQTDDSDVIPPTDAVVSRIAESMRSASSSDLTDEEREQAEHAYEVARSNARFREAQRKRREEEQRQREVDQREADEAARKKAERTKASRERVKAFTERLSPASPDNRLNEIAAESRRASLFRNAAVHYGRRQRLNAMHDEILADMENLFIDTGMLPPKPLPVVRVADED